MASDSRAQWAGFLRDLHTKNLTLWVPAMNTQSSTSTQSEIPTIGYYNPGGPFDFDRSQMESFAKITLQSYPQVIETLKNYNYTSVNLVNNASSSGDSFGSITLSGLSRTVSAT